MLPLCALCDTLITNDNDSKEHIIPNSIGGKKKLNGFICESCNNSTGDDWDVAFAKQLNPLCLIFRIKRDRKKVPSQNFETTEGKKVRLNADGTMGLAEPNYTEVKTNVGVNINIQARTMKEAEQLAGRADKYTKRTGQQLDFDPEERNMYLGGELKISTGFGGELAGRSIVKSMLAVAKDAGITPQTCESARNYLVLDKSDTCFGFYYDSDLVVNRPAEMPLHCVCVRGIPETSQLLGYAEYFGIYRVVSCLSRKYEGPEFIHNYAINPKDGTRQNLQINLDFSPAEISKIFNNIELPLEAFTQAMNEVMTPHFEALQEEELNRVCQEAWRHGLENSGAKEGELLDDAQSKRAAGFAMQKLEPYILHLMAQARKRDK